MTQNNIKIAITGGIGSGKSTVAEIIQRCGYPVFSCDVIYRELLRQGVFNESFTAEFGNVFLPNGELDRKLLSSIVFSDKEKLKTLNRITHGVVMQSALKKANRAAEAFGACFVEVQLLFEEGYERYFDKVIVVTRPLGKRIEGLKERDGLSQDQILRRMEGQFNYDRADLNRYEVLENDGDLGNLEVKTKRLLDKLFR